MQLAALYRRSTQWKVALEMYETALKLIRDIPDLYLEVEVLNHMASTVHEIKDTKQAMEYLKEAMELSQKRSYDVGEAATWSNYGLMYQDMGKKWQAIRHLEKALAVAKKSRRSGSVAAASLKLAKVLVEQERWDKAVPHARLAQQLYAKMGRSEMAATIDALLSDIEKNKGRSIGFFSTDLLRSLGDF
jgi:tetratricopeptide (TPR) repeat protein